MALALPGGNVRAMQRFIGEGAWDDAAILVAHHRLVAGTLGEPDGVLIVDGSDFPKQGTASVGGARQYCGALARSPTARPGWSWRLRVGKATRWWIGACTCQQTGSLRPMRRAAHGAASRRTWRFAPRRSWRGR